MRVVNFFVILDLGRGFWFFGWIKENAVKKKFVSLDMAKRTCFEHFKEARAAISRKRRADHFTEAPTATAVPRVFGISRKPWEPTLP